MHLINDSLSTNSSSKEISPDKCYYCLRKPSIIPYNDFQYSLFLEKTKKSPYKICYTCWSILRSLKINDNSLFKFIKEDRENTKPRTAFKFAMLTNCSNRTNLIAKALQKEQNELTLEGFRDHDSNAYPVNLLIIESSELLMFIFDITFTHSYSNTVQMYLQLTEINLLIIDGNDLENSIAFLQECNNLYLSNVNKYRNSYSILLGLNFNTFDNSKRQKIVALKDELIVDQWFLMDSEGNKKDSSIIEINTVSDFFFASCKSYLELSE